MTTDKKCESCEHFHRIPSKRNIGRCNGPDDGVYITEVSGWCKDWTKKEEKKDE